MSGERKRIMLVDDNPVNLRTGKNVLAAHYEVYTAPSARKMFELLEVNTVDMLLLDINMPYMDGLEALKILKDNPKTEAIPVVFLTGMAEKDYVRKACALGAKDFIVKPFEPPLLLDRVETLLSGDAEELEMKSEE